MTLGPEDNDIFVGGIDVEGGVLAGPDAVVPTVILHVTGFASLEERQPVQLRLHFQAEDLAGLAKVIEATAAQSIASAQRAR
ncbi:hypothetical protein [Cryptosporangium sp. NPDC048952]|uniref:hypothetical protein n=1 Tax=Cryptosporangium sp. NPDC048952 TaxID=3363961 RepID=UPI00371ED9A0